MHDLDSAALPDCDLKYAGDHYLVSTQKLTIDELPQDFRETTPMYETVHGEYNGPYWVVARYTNVKDAIEGHAKYVAKTKLNDEESRKLRERHVFRLRAKGPEVELVTEETDSRYNEGGFCYVTLIVVGRHTHVEEYYPTAKEAAAGHARHVASRASQLDAS